MPTETVEQTEQQQQNTPVVHEPDFGNGKYSALMWECYEDAQVVFGLSPIVADKLAQKIASDWGAYMASQKTGMDNIKFGKVNKDNKVTLSEAAIKVKGVSMTYPLQCLKTLCWAGEAGKNLMNFGHTKWVVGEKLEAYFKKLAE